MINNISSMSSFNYQIPESQIERPEGFQGNSKDTFVRDQSKDLETEKSFRDMGELFLAKRKKGGKSGRTQGPKGPQGPGRVDNNGVGMFPGREGYKTDFLGKDYPLPTLGDSIKDKASHLIGKPDEIVLDYTHFSVVQNAERKQCFFTATNIDGSQSKEIPRSGDWIKDGRIPLEDQLGNEAYSNNTIDRGHMTRRLDPAWGDQASLGSLDTFVYTNSTLQCEGLNQKEWLELENHVLDTASSKGQKLTVLQGPIFSDSDPTFTNHGRVKGGVKIPQQFWKVVVWKDDKTGDLKQCAFVLSQKDILENSSDLGLFKGGFEPGRFGVYQVPMKKLEEMTDLHFAPAQDVTVEGAKLTAANNFAPTIA